MAKQDGLSARSLVLDTFKSQVAVLCSPAAQELCEKNNLQFTQLIQPFSSLTTEVSWQEPYGQNVSIKGLRIHPVDLSSWKPLGQDAQKNKQIQNNVVSQSIPPLSLTDGNDSQLFQLQQFNGRSRNYSVQVPKSSPWFEKWRETFLKFHSEQQQSQHEYLNQFIACILVIAASEVKSSEDLSTILGKLSKLQLQHQREWPQTWFFPSVLKFYLILHDQSSDNPTSSEGSYQSLRTTYGANFCYLLRLNSRGLTNDGEEKPVSDIWANLFQKEHQRTIDDISQDSAADFDEIESTKSEEPFHPLSPSSEFLPKIQTSNGELKSANGNFIIPRGKCFTTQDLQNIQIAINEFIAKSLLPYIERQAKVMHESILNRRGMSKSFFSATKRLFGTGTKTASSIVYASESPEMSCRKLADLYFLFGHYSGAYQFYHQIKKDFQADSAWIYYASSLEMAALSHFMMTQTEPPMAVTRSFPIHYITEAITNYIDLCRMPDAATRCAIICCECLNQVSESGGNFGEAAAIFIRMTSEDCDLRSALMLEQAAYSFVKLSSPRKYALHSVLAGHRYAKAGLRTHSLNCYLQAYQVYTGRGWRFAEDHVQFTIARHQTSLQIYTGLSKRLLSLLKTPTVQPVAQVQTFYKEFVTVAAKLYEDDKIPKEVFIPTLVNSDIRILIATTGLAAGEISNQKLENVVLTNWDSLEEQVVRECVDASVIIFKPYRLLFDGSSDNTVYPTVPCNETFYIEIPLLNPLSTDLVLQNISLKFDVDTVQSSIIDTLSLQPGETKTVRFGASCSTKGMISFDWIRYDFELSTIRVPFIQKLSLFGPRLNTTQQERSSRTYAKDLRNKIKIAQELPLFLAEVEHLPSTLFHSQWIDFNLLLRDKSNDTRQRERVSKIVIASENMSNCLQIRRNSVPPSSNFVLESVQKNYCPLKVVMDGSPTTRIPCLYKVPPVGEMTVLNILVLYKIKPEKEDVPVSFSPFGSVIYRVIKISIKIPLLSSLKFEHSCLKKLGIQTTVNLLRVQNLTKDKTIAVQDMNFEPNLVAVENISWGGAELEKVPRMLQLEPAQCCNIIFHARVLDSDDSENKQKLLLTLKIKWQVNNDNTSSANTCSNGVLDNNNTEDSRITGYHQVPVSKQDIFSSSSADSIVFQLRHVSRRVHDFYQYPCYVCPVELVLSHHPKPGKVILKIEKDKGQAAGTPNSSLSSSSQAVFFVGKTTWILDGEDNVGQQQQFTFNVAITRPGIYNVAPTISVKRPDDGTQQIYDLHSPFVIDQA